MTSRDAPRRSPHSFLNIWGVGFVGGLVFRIGTVCVKRKGNHGEYHFGMNFCSVNQNEEKATGAEWSVTA